MRDFQAVFVDLPASVQEQVEVDQSREQDAELVPGPVGLRPDAARVAELAVLEQPEDGLRVSGVYGEEQLRTKRLHRQSRHSLL